MGLYWEMHVLNFIQHIQVLFILLFLAIPCGNGCVQVKEKICDYQTGTARQPNVISLIRGQEKRREESDTVSLSLREGEWKKEEVRELETTGSKL